MLNSKFNIYSSEWIERVFENRNKSYGAYDIRKHYAANLLRAFGITILALILIFLISLLFNQKPASVNIHKGVVEVTNRSIQVIPETPEKKTDKSHTSSQPRQVANATAKHLAVNTPVPVPVLNPAPPISSVPAVTNIPSKGNDVDQRQTSGTVDNDDVDVKPMPIGGAEEWSRFLEVNLHYPALAKQNRISGKVWVSFIVERDGHISNVVVEHAAGHGFDEEAVRVLNMAPVWAPGKQNGQIVRVKYTLPINFHIEHL
jgi:protein TonB